MVYLLFKTDHHHSFASRDLIGVFTNKTKFRKAVKELIKDDIQTDSGRMDKQEEDEHIKWLYGFCLDKGQTQGLNDFELVWEEVELNKIF